MLDLGHPDAQLRLADAEFFGGPPEMQLAGEHRQQLIIASPQVHSKIHMM